MPKFFRETEKTVQTIVSRLAKNDPTLQEVDCSQLNLDSLLSKSIFTALKHSTHVKKLKFLGNNPGEAIKDLSDSIKEHQSLEEVYLGTNGLGDKELSYLTTCLKENLSSVQVLDLNSNEEITDASVPHIVELLKNSTHIKKMDISFTKITDNGLREILNVLESNPNSPLLELCDSHILNYGYFTQDEELTKKLVDFFNAKKIPQNELTFSK